MFNGLANSFRLGLRWCACFFAFAALASDSDIVQSIDSLYNLQSVNWAYVIDIANDVSDIASDAGYLVDIYDALGYPQNVSGRRTVAQDLGSLRDNLSSIANYVSMAYDTSYHGFDVKDEVLRHDMEGFRDDVRFYSRMVTNLQEQANSKLDSVVSSIDNLTNYLGQSEISLQPDLMTNLLFLSSWHLYSPPTTLSPDSYPNDASIKNMFNYLFGRQPTSSELTKYRTLVKRWGQGAQQLFEISSWIDPDNDLDNGSNNNGLFGDYRNNWFSTQENNIAKRIAKVRYHQYGTLPLLEFFQQATNDYLLAGSSVTMRYPSPDGEGENSGFTQEFKDTVSDLSDSFLPTVEDDVSDVDTNEITQVSDSGYAGQLNKIKENDILGAGQLEDLQGVVDDINNSFSSSVPVLGVSDTLSLNFGTFSLFGSSKSISFTIPKLPKLYWDIQSFLFSFLKAVCLFIVVTSLLRFISQDTQV